MQNSGLLKHQYFIISRRYINQLSNSDNASQFINSDNATFTHKAGVTLKQLFTKLKQEIIFQLWFQIFLSFPRQWAAERTQICPSRFLDRRRKHVNKVSLKTPALQFHSRKQGKHVLSHSKISRYY